MERYLEGEEISHEEIVTALKDGTNHGHLFPVTCGMATRNLATNRLLDAIVEDLPSPVKHGGLAVGEVTLEPDEDAELFAYVFKTRADPFAGRINLFRVYQGVMKHDTQVLNTRTHTKERIGQLLTFDGAETRARRRVRARGHRRRGQAQGDPRRGLAGVPRRADHACRAIKLPAPVMAFAIGGAEEQGRRGQGVHRPAPPPGGGPDDRPAPRSADRRADRRRALPGPRRGDRRAAEGALRGRGQPQAAAGALSGDDPQAGQGPRAPQEADRGPGPVRRLPHRDRAAEESGVGRLRVRQRDQGRRDPVRVHPRGARRACKRPCRRARSRAIRSRTSGCASTTAPTTPSTPRRWRSRWRGQWPCARRWRRPARCCWSRSWR